MKPYIIILFTMLIAACRSNQNPPPIKTGMEGKPISAFDVLLPDSTTKFNMANIPNGEPAVVIFFSPYCPFCRAEISDVVKNISALHNAQLYLITNFPLTTLKKFIHGYHLNQYANIVVGQDCKNFVLSRYKITGIPFTEIYDRQKHLKNAFIGLMSAQQIKQVAGI